MKKEIAKFYGLTIVAIDGSDKLVIEDENGLTLHVNARECQLEEEISGDIKYIWPVVQSWWRDMKNRIFPMLESGIWDILPNWEE